MSVPGLHLERYAEDPTPQAVADGIAEQARRAARNPQTAILARQELAPFVGSLIEALGRFAKSIAVVREPLDGAGEIITSPWRTVAYRRGDCDDVAAAVLAFASTFGLPCMSAVVATSPGFAHAVALVGDDPYLPGRLTHVIDQAHGARILPEPFPALALAGVR